MSRIAICHACPQFNRDSGSCGIDGFDVLEHAAGTDCPRGKFSESKPVKLYVRASEKTINLRMAVCRQCPNVIEINGRVACGILRKDGRSGWLDHWRGVPNPSSKCPDGRWFENTEPIASVDGVEREANL